ncbi:hypothetical protein SCA03_49160 [Streptomyces cacaoi]|uniref:Uncharacterized protein n=1 Tax=Streptomyces cacaoi TaxID=1898 RepID=A0A4Y3R3U8_STRCI|nr:hypothetical protein SCA03_49160 [Streptomyces cacaoi]
MAASGGMTIATTHIPIAAGTDHRRTKAQALTKSTRHRAISAKYRRRLRAYMSPRYGAPAGTRRREDGPPRSVALVHSSSRGLGPSVRPVGGLRLPARYGSGQGAPGPL